MHAHLIAINLLLIIQKNLYFERCWQSLTSATSLVASTFRTPASIDFWMEKFYASKLCLSPACQYSFYFTNHQQHSSRRYDCFWWARLWFFVGYVRKLLHICFKANAKTTPRCYRYTLGKQYLYIYIIPLTV